MRNNRIHKLTRLALVISFALILSYVESQLPPISAIAPGIKIGLANIAVIFVLYRFGIPEAITVSIIRVIIVAMLFGTPVSFFYSISGAVLSLAVMAILKKLTPLKEVAVSVTGGLMHNVGQILAAWVLLNDAVLYYLPILMLSGTVAGIFVGIAAAILIKRVKL